MTYGEICKSFGGVSMPPLIWGESGVYCISCEEDGKRYVGCSKHILKRLGQHFRQLQRGTHRNKSLQSAWNKYGATKFYAFVLQYTEDIYTVEMDWVNQLSSYGGSQAKVVTEDEAQILVLFGWSKGRV